MHALECATGCTSWICNNRTAGLTAGVSLLADAPIVSALHRLSDNEKARLEKKFDIAHFVATEKLPFTKYASICALESKHGLDLSSSYKNEVAGKTFCHFNAEIRRNDLKRLFSNIKFFSVLMDSSTDKANMDNELILVIWCDTNGTDEKVTSKMTFLCVAQPTAATAMGLFDCLQ